jgi:hypothetical protein
MIKVNKYENGEKITTLGKRATKRKGRSNH